MGANIAGIYGAQIFRADDRPLYQRGFSIAIAVLAFGLSLAIARWIDDLFIRRRARKNDAAVLSGAGASSDDGAVENGEKTIETLPKSAEAPEVVAGTIKRDDLK
jgi:hypothetical protein